MRNRLKELTPEEIKEQEEYIRAAERNDTVNKSAAAKAGAALGRANHGGPHPIWAKDDAGQTADKPESQQNQ